MCACSLGPRPVLAVALSPSSANRYSFSGDLPFAHLAFLRRQHTLPPTLPAVHLSPSYPPVIKCFFLPLFFP